MSIPEDIEALARDVRIHQDASITAQCGDCGITAEQAETRCL